jgi:hypothetical protein
LRDKKARRLDVQSLGEHLEGAQCDVVLNALDPADKGPVNPTYLGETLLR